MKKYIRSEDYEDFVYRPKYKDLDEAYMNYKAIRISKYMPKKQQAELRKKKAAYKKQMEELRKKYAEESYVRSDDDLTRDVSYEYGYYNETAKDKEYFIKSFTNRGYKNVKVKRIATDTPRLKMYEVSYDRPDSSITSATEISSAMQDMINSIADEWKKDIEDQDCENFKEFCQLNDYTAADIRDELRYMIQNHYDGWMYDDGTIVVASDESEMPYREFKKAVVDKLK